ncbi:MAG: zinc-binding dehydrogenase [Victivallales bacterium]|nr:zinc-binding dehydrogenase [Victivallales bacterium]MCF7889069.1 zinc-binding dehydrogenase [Victivallales bacterium]
MKQGNPYGIHRVIEPARVLPQPALKISNDMELFDNEIRVNVDILNVDSASFTQIKEQAGGDSEKIKEIILDLVKRNGKLKNPVTGSGGMFIGNIDAIGDKIKSKVSVKEGDRIASLVSLSLTPLKIDEIVEVKKNIDQVVIKGQAILFESAIYAKLPDDIPPSLALAVLDVAGAPAQTERLVKKDNTVAIIGAAGKSGILCAYAAKKAAGPNGKIIGMDYSDENLKLLKSLELCDEVIKLDATDAISCYEKAMAATNGKLCDVVINNVNIQNTEMGSILMTKDRGTVYFFSMATSFTKAALGAEGVGKDIDMIVGNGYAYNHANIAINIIRESTRIRELYKQLYV